MLLVTTVHQQSLCHFGLIVAESIALLQKPIHKGSLAVVNVRDNRHISNFFWIHNLFSSLKIVILAPNTLPLFK